MSDDPNLLVSTGWLAARLDDPRIRILDASWHMPAAGRDARAEYEAAHIPGAQFFDIDAIAARGTDLPHMVAPAVQFTEMVGALGIGDGDQVVVYDNAATRSASRVWWNFRLMGIAPVAVLDGGLGKWRAEGRPVTSERAEPLPAQLNARPVPDLLRDMTQVAAVSDGTDAVIVDARSAERFRGEAAEPRPGLRSGHIPGSRNLPFDRLYHADGTMKDAVTLSALFTQAGVDLSRPVITSCGSGISAASLSLALERAGHRNHALYDGSWTEWGAHPDMKIATGEQ
ncbi:MAG: 3-mercaptopyruvate sulfurtransferase [Paracoccus sp. (in: a-proteobacteria)]